METNQECSVVVNIHVFSDQDRRLEVRNKSRVFSGQCLVISIGRLEVRNKSRVFSGQYLVISIGGWKLETNQECSVGSLPNLLKQKSPKDNI